MKKNQLKNTYGIKYIKYVQKQIRQTWTKENQRNLTPLAFWFKCTVDLYTKYTSRVHNTISGIYDEFNSFKAPGIISWKNSIGYSAYQCFTI